MRSRSGHGFIHKRKGFSPHLVHNVSLPGSSFEAAQDFTVWSEVKRLFGSPWRALVSLLLILLPLLLALSGGLDLLASQLYLWASRQPADKRVMVSLTDCLLTGGGGKDSHKAVSGLQGLCQGLTPFSLKGDHRLVLYPFHTVKPLAQFEPWLFPAFLLLAWFIFTANGSPRLSMLGTTLGQALGLRNAGMLRQAPGQKIIEALGMVILVGREKGQTNTRAAGSELVPQAFVDRGAPHATWQSHLLLGCARERLWQPDPGFFYLSSLPPFLQEGPGHRAKTSPFTSTSAKQGSGMPLSGVPYWLSVEHLRTNLLVVAPPGSGKTCSVFQPLARFIRKAGGAALFWDSKGTDFDPALFDYNFDLLHPERSIRLNLFAGTTPDQAGERLGEALIPQLSDDKAYFSNVAKDAMATLVSAHHAAFGEYPSLLQLLLYLEEIELTEALRHKVLVKLAKGKRREEALRLSAGLRRLQNLAALTKGDALGQLSTALAPLCTGPASRLLVTNDNDPNTPAYTVQELLSRPGLVRLALPVAELPRVAPIIGRLVLAQFNFAVLSPTCNRQIFKLAAVDEAHNFITGTIARGMAQARATNAGFALALQTLSQVGEKSLLDTIFAASGIKIVMRGVSDEDAERFSRTFGEEELPYVSHSTSSSKSTSRNTASSTSRGSEFEFFSNGKSGTESRSSVGRSRGSARGTTAGQADTSMLRVRRRFLPAEVRELGQYQAIIEASDAEGRRWFARVVELDRRLVKKLEEEVQECLDRLSAREPKGKVAGGNFKGSENFQPERPKGGFTGSGPNLLFSPASPSSRDALFTSNSPVQVRPGLKEGAQDTTGESSTGRATTISSKGNSRFSVGVTSSHSEKLRPAASGAEGVGNLPEKSQIQELSDSTANQILEFEPLTGLPTGTGPHAAVWVMKKAPSGSTGEKRADITENNESQEPGEIIPVKTMPADKQSLTGGEKIANSNTGSNRDGEIRQLLQAAGLTEDLVEEALTLMRHYNRSRADLVRLLAFVSSRHEVKDKAAYLLFMLRKNSFPVGRSTTTGKKGQARP
ncbi:MAG TPA: type IV secretion system DNA-binding domain-containing protein [Chloroflexia bacterium]|nr:type IV secretion system DNA-binding domain-containing protein [Chloroflexia bacterium]